MFFNGLARSPLNKRPFGHDTLLPHFRAIRGVYRIGAGSVRRTRGQCSWYINEWPPWGKTFTPCAYLRLGYFQAVAAKRSSKSLADGPELRQAIQRGSSADGSRLNPTCA